MIKTLSELGREDNFLNLIKNIYKKPTPNIVLHGEEKEFFQAETNTPL